jgi:hypothetical protein
MILLKHDPGPCVVDDCPHTACTSADYDAKTGRTVTIVAEARPPRDGPRQPRSAPHIVTRSPSERAFTTATYARKPKRTKR